VSRREHPPPARTALVTGANRGLGRGLALGLAADGVAVGLLGRRRDALEAVAREIREAGGRAAVVPADVRSYEATMAAVAAVEAMLGGVDLLVNNAGVVDPVEVPVWEAEPQDWWDVVETDLRGPFHCVRAVVPGMLRRGGGRVIDLNSGAGARDREVYSAYCAAKAGLFRIGGSLHLAGFERGLRSFELSPNVVETDMTHSMPMHEGRSEWTPVETVVALAVALARGELDAWSGCFLRAGADTPESLAAAAAELTGDPEGRVPAPFRRLVVHPYGPSDPIR
jgi:3-oxoacyl-[acyl-carrier protein] reductase